MSIWADGAVLVSVVASVESATMFAMRRLVVCARRFMACMVAG